MDEKFKEEFVKEYNGDFDSLIREALDEDPALKELLREKQEKIAKQQEEQRKKEKESESPSLEDEPEDELEGKEEDELKISPIIDLTGTEIVLFKGDKIKDKEIIIDLKEGENDSKIKKLYRKIVLKTHPDKLGSDALMHIYLDATYSYKQDDIFSIYLICNQLNIEYTLEDTEVKDFKKQINQVKFQNNMIEKSYIWIWFHSKDKEKKSIIRNFLINYGHTVNYKI